MLKSWILGSIGFLTLIACYGQPANDLFRNAEVLQGDSIQGSVGLTNATFEAGEPLGLDQTVWYRWTTRTQGVATVSIIGNVGKPVSAAVFVGDWPNLRIIDWAYNSALISFKFPVPGAQTVSIQVARGGPSYGLRAETASWAISLQTAGSVVEDLNVQNPATVESDEFAHAIVLTGELASGIAYPRWFERSPIDPAEAGSNNTWYSWTAPHAGTAQVTCATPWPVTQFGSLFDRKALGVFTGPDLAHLTTVAAAAGTGTIFATFEPVPGQVYWIAAGSQTADAQVGWIITTLKQAPKKITPLAIEKAARLQVATQTGKLYQIQVSDHLGGWINLGENFRGAGQLDWLYIPTTSTAAQFFRVIEFGP